MPSLLTSSLATVQPGDDGGEGSPQAIWIVSSTHQIILLPNSSHWIPTLPNDHFPFPPLDHSSTPGILPCHPNQPKSSSSSCEVEQGITSAHLNPSPTRPHRCQVAPCSTPSPCCLPFNCRAGQGLDLGMLWSVGAGMEGEP